MSFQQIFLKTSKSAPIVPNSYFKEITNQQRSLNSMDGSKRLDVINSVLEEERS